MLEPQITIYDIAWFLMVALFILGWYVAYNSGYNEGFIDGGKIRRKEERRIRRHMLRR